jgi:hypothetical protein
MFLDPTDLPISSEENKCWISFLWNVFSLLLLDSSRVHICLPSTLFSNTLRLWRVRSSGLYHCLARREPHVSEEHRLHPQGQLATCFCGCLVCSIFDTEDRWNVLWSVGISLSYTGLQSEWLHSSQAPPSEPQTQSPLYILPLMWRTKFSTTQNYRQNVRFCN